MLLAYCKLLYTCHGRAHHRCTWPMACKQQLLGHWRKNHRCRTYWIAHGCRRFCQGALRGGGGVLNGAAGAVAADARLSKPASWLHQKSSKCGPIP